MTFGGQIVPEGIVQPSTDFLFKSDLLLTLAARCEQECRDRPSDLATRATAVALFWHLTRNVPMEGEYLYPDDSIEWNARRNLCAGILGSLARTLQIDPSFDWARVKWELNCCYAANDPWLARKLFAFAEKNQNQLAPLIEIVQNRCLAEFLFAFGEMIDAELGAELGSIVVHAAKYGQDSCFAFSPSTLNFDTKDHFGESEHYVLLKWGLPDLAGVTIRAGMRRDWRQPGFRIFGFSGFDLPCRWGDSWWRLRGRACPSGIAGRTTTRGSPAAAPSSAASRSASGFPAAVAPTRTICAARRRESRGRACRWDRGAVRGRADPALRASVALRFRGADARAASGRRRDGCF